MIEKITQYFRDAVVSQTRQQIEIDKDSEKVSFDAILNGKVDIEPCERLFRSKCKETLSSSDDVDADAEGENRGQQIKVIVALQVVNVRASGGMKHESDVADLTGTFFLPANLSGTGMLSPETDNIPWIPRNFPLISLFHPIWHKVGASWKKRFFPARIKNATLRAV
jgi:hypothetical protein